MGATSIDVGIQKSEMLIGPAQESPLVGALLPGSARISRASKFCSPSFSGTDAGEYITDCGDLGESE